MAVTVITKNPYLENSLKRYFKFNNPKSKLIFLDSSDVSNLLSFFKMVGNKDEINDKIILLTYDMEPDEDSAFRFLSRGPLFTKGLKNRIIRFIDLPEMLSGIAKKERINEESL